MEDTRKSDQATQHLDQTTQQPNGQGSYAEENIPEELRRQALAQLRERLDYRTREIVEVSGIDPTVALERGYYLEKTKIGLERLGFKRRQQQVPAIVIPRFSPSGGEAPPQAKPDSPRLVESAKGVREVKYESVAGSNMRLSVHPRTVELMRDRRYALWVTEGDKKGDALVSRGAVAVVLQGVGCWDIPQDWEDIKLHGREVIIAFDADVMINPGVQGELDKLSSFLRGRGAKVRFLRWPERYKGTTTGVDDVLAAGEATIQEVYGWAEETPDEDAIPVGVCMADIKPERVEWFWERRIPLGKVTMLDGDPGKGKSTILYDLAARVTAGKPLPDGQPIEKGGALVVSMEDGASDTIVPRFLAAGGDPTRARVLGAETQLTLPDDLDKLERAIQQTNARFVAIDPVMSFLADNVNTNSDQQVRRALQPVVDLAERTGAAVVLCRHLNKSGEGPAIYRGQGSIGLIGIARSGLMVGEHPDEEDLLVLAGAKGNLSEKPDSLAYKITSAVTVESIITARIEYQGRTEITAEQMNAAPRDEGERSKLTQAKQFLRNVLRAGPVLSKQVKKEASEADIGWRTVERAKAQLKVDDYKDDASGKYMWLLPAPPEDGDESRKSSPRRSEAGGPGGPGGPEVSSSPPPNLADLADLANDTTTDRENEAYIKEVRHLRHLRQDPVTTDELTTSPPPPNTSAKLGGPSLSMGNRVIEDSKETPISFAAPPGRHKLDELKTSPGGAKRRLTEDEARRVQGLIADGMAPKLARAEVTGEELERGEDS